MTTSGYTNLRLSDVSAEETNDLETRTSDLRKRFSVLGCEDDVEQIQRYVQPTEKRFRICLCDPDVVNLAKRDDFRGGMVPMALCVGPAISIARRSAILGWLFVLLLSTLAFQTSQCTDDGFVYYPWQLWIVFIPLIAIRLYWQVQCLKYALVPFVQAAGRFAFLRVFDMGLTVWLIATSLASIGQTLDYGTDSFFIAVVLRTGQCSNSIVEEIWKVVLSQSTFPLCALQGLTFSHIALLSYALMFLQPLRGFLDSTSQECCEDTTEYVVGGDCSEFTNCVGNKKNFGDALFELADIADMACIQLMSPGFPKAKAAKVWETTSDMSEAVPRISSLVHNALNRSLGRIGLVSLLENAFQMNLQVSVLGLFFFITDNGNEAQDTHKLAKLQIQTQLSIVFGVVQALARVGEIVQILAFSGWTICRFNEARKRQGSHQEDSDSSSSNDRADNIGKEMLWVLVKAFMVCVLSVMLFVSSGYAIVKFVHVVWLCEDRLWNLTGCVDMSRFKS